MNQLKIRTEQLKDLQNQLNIAIKGKYSINNKRIKQLKLMIERVKNILNSLNNQYLSYMWNHNNLRICFG